MSITTSALPNDTNVGVERPISSITNIRTFRFRGRDRLWTSHEDSDDRMLRALKLGDQGRLWTSHGDTHVWSSEDRGHL
jgi:hypothetical protein